MGTTRMNAESYPSVSLATATVITNYDGASAEDMEIKVTKPLEDEIRAVTGLKDVKSISQAGLSTIVIRVDMDDSNVEVEKTMSDIQKAIDRTSKLPADLRDPPIFTEIKSEEFPVMEIAIVGSNNKRQRDLKADFFKEDLEDIKGVKNVRLVGFSPKNFSINLIPEKMKSLHVGLDEITTAIEARNKNTPGERLSPTQLNFFYGLKEKLKIMKN